VAGGNGDDQNFIISIAVFLHVLKLHRDFFVMPIRSVVWICGDAVKNREEAESETYREKTWDWFTSVAFTRLHPRGVMIVIMTRWQVDDLAGRIMESLELSAMTKILKFPAIANTSGLNRKAGEALWPERYNLDWLIEQREDVGPYEFEALYQLQPYSKQGQHYKHEWFKTVTQIPEGVTIKFAVRYWDKANATKGDYTVGVLMVFCSDGYFYILDVVRGKWTSYERDQKMRATTEKDSALTGLAYKAKIHTWHQQDPGSAGKDSAEATNRVLMGFPAFFEPVSGDKETRSEPLESAFQGGLVFLLQAAWNEEFINECVSFPRGRNDDQVDAASSAYNKLLYMNAKHRKSSIG